MAALIPFDDRDGQIWWDGELIPWRDAKLHVLSHGLHYASAVFEGQRAYNGNVFRLRDHSERLVRSGRILGFEIPWTLDQIDQAAIDVLRVNNLTSSYVRPLAWRGAEQLSVSAQATKIHLIDATAHGHDDALMLDWRGHVSEATGANIFFVFDGALHTPTPDCFLDGLTRQTVISLAKKRRIEVVVRTIMPDEMAHAREVFVTGSAAEVTPVRRIDDRHFEIGPITAQLHADYEALVNMSPAEAERRLAA